MAFKPVEIVAERRTPAPSPLAFSPERRAQLRQDLWRLRDQGIGWPTIAARLGISESSVYRLRSLGRVDVIARAPESLPASCRPVLVSPGGYRVEGMDLEGVADLLRRLS